jgi:hypothetical protein
LSIAECLLDEVVLRDAAKNLNLIVDDGLGTPVMRVLAGRSETPSLPRQTR